jgi:hypothetical protein
VIRLAGGYRDIQNRYREALASHLHGGLEIDILKRFFIRAGALHGYATGGLGVDLPGIELDITTYSREVGEKALGAEDRLYMLQLKVGF